MIGNSGTGTFTQTGGSHNVTGYGYGIFVIGDSTTGIGTYNLKDGSLTLVNGFEEYIGNSGKGYFNQSGGTHDASNSAVYLGVSTGGYGEYNMSGGMFKAGGLALGESGGTGKFYHSGGEVTVSNLELARQNLSNGYYELSGSGKLKVNGNLNVGVKGDGYFKQTGGTNQVNGTLTISVNPGISTGTYEMMGGRLNAVNIVNNGTFNFTGGTLSPGLSPGTLNFVGNYTQGDLAKLLIELGGTTQGTDPGYDFLNITGTATLGGVLDVELYGGFIPQVGNVFDILQAQVISGTFGSYDLPYGISYWDVTYGTNIVSLEYLGGGQPVPVPSTLLLLGTGLIGLAGLMRRELKR